MEGSDIYFNSTSSYCISVICLPFILILSITGGIYLFKDKYEQPIHEPIKKVVKVGTPISYQKQWEIANAQMPNTPNAMLVPMAQDQATEFISGQFSHKSSIFVGPYKAQVTGIINADDGFMHKVRKLHGELFLGKFGTKVVELIASWFIALILTGVYVFWPFGKQGFKAFFVPRVNAGRRNFFRDVHGITGFFSE